MQISLLSRQKKSLSYWGQIIALGLVVGLGLQIANAWTNPSGTPPDNGNITAPLTTSGDKQVKSGGLHIGGDAGNFDVNGNGFAVTGANRVRFAHSANVDLYIQGGASSGGGDLRNLAFYGTTDANSDTLYINHAGEYQGGIRVGSTNATYMRPVCVNNLCLTDWRNDFRPLTEPASRTFRQDMTSGSIRTMGLGSWDICVLSGVEGLDGDDIDGFSCRVYPAGGGNWTLQNWGDDYNRVSCWATCMNW